MEKLYTINDVAELLQVPASTIRGWISSYIVLPHTRATGKICFTAGQICRMYENKKAKERELHYRDIREFLSKGMGSARNGWFTIDGIYTPLTVLFTNSAVIFTADKIDENDIASLPAENQPDVSKYIDILEHFDRNGYETKKPEKDRLYEIINENKKRFMSENVLTSISKGKARERVFRSGKWKCSPETLLKTLNVVSRGDDDCILFVPKGDNAERRPALILSEISNDAGFVLPCLSR